MTHNLLRDAGFFYKLITHAINTPHSSQNIAASEILQRGVLRENVHNLRQTERENTVEGRTALGIYTTGITIRFLEIHRLKPHSKK